MTDLTLKRAEAAERCINRIQDFLEYRWEGKSAKFVRDIVLDKIGMYADEMQKDCEDE